MRVESSPIMTKSTNSSLCEKKKLYKNRVNMWLASASVIEQNIDKLEVFEQNAFWYLRNIFDNYDFDETTTIEQQIILRDASNSFLNDFGVALCTFASCTGCLIKNFNLFRVCLAEVETNAQVGNLEKPIKTIGPSPELQIERESNVPDFIKGLKESHKCPFLTSFRNILAWVITIFVVEAILFEQGDGSAEISVISAIMSLIMLYTSYITFNNKLILISFVFTIFLNALFIHEKDIDGRVLFIAYSSTIAYILYVGNGNNKYGFWNPLTFIGLAIVVNSGVHLFIYLIHHCTLSTYAADSSVFIRTLNFIFHLGGKDWLFNESWKLIYIFEGEFCLFLGLSVFCLGFHLKSNLCKFSSWIIKIVLVLSTILCLQLGDYSAFGIFFILLFALWDVFLYSATPKSLKSLNSEVYIGWKNSFFLIGISIIINLMILIFNDNASIFEIMILGPLGLCSIIGGYAGINTLDKMFNTIN